MMMASGFAGLGYQIIWTEQCSLWFGHESAGVLAVLAAFFGGLAVGGLSFGARIERSAHPVRWYAACELVIALWSLLLLCVASPITGSVLRLIGVQPAPFWHWLVVFCSALVLFLPATAAMGATLPAMERSTAIGRSDDRSIAALYGINTFGAVLGVLVTAFWLVPRVGLSRSAAVCAVLNAGCSVLALVLFPKSTPPAPISPNRALGDARGVLIRLAFTGLLGIGYEVLVVRVLSQITEDTVYTFALLLAVYLIGTAAGAASYQRWLTKLPDRDQLGDRLLAGLAACCLAGTVTLYAGQQVRGWAQAALGADMAGALATEALLALLAFGPPTVLMGALFSHLSRSASAAGVSFGRAFGINTLPAAIAPLLFGVVSLPVLGAKVALLTVVLGYLALVTRRSWSSTSFRLTAAASFAVVLFAPPLTFIDVPEGGHVVSYQEGALAAVSVVEDAVGVRTLRINDRQQEGSNATLRVDGRQAWLPLLLHPAPQHVLFLGLGTGVTSAAAAEDSALQVDVVELLPEVVSAARYFTGQLSEAANARLHVMTADARRHVRASERRYDLIVSDNFHPARSGSGALYTVEHFEAVRARLASGGIFCQWLPLHQLDLETLRSIVRSFVNVYPKSWAMLASSSLETPVIGLVARSGGERFDLETLRQRIAHPSRPELLVKLGFDDEFSVLGSVIAGPAALQRFSSRAQANTDDRPVVMYGAPRATYEPESMPRDRLVSLLNQLSSEPAEILNPPRDPEFFLRLAAYWRARDRFIALGRDVRPSARVEEMLAQVREPLLSVLRISPDFRPAYDPLLAMAEALAYSDAAAAETLLGELTRLQPARADAARMQARIETMPSAQPVRH